MMGEKIIAELIAQGGLYLIIGVLLFLLGGAIYACKRLFDELLKSHQVTRELGERVVSAIDAAQRSIDVTTRAVESNAKVGEAQRLAHETLRQSVEHVIALIIRGRQ